MIDAKRLAELMEPEKLRSLAKYLEGLQLHNSSVDSDAAECAAAVLRDVAGRAPDKVIEVDLQNAPRLCPCVGCEEEIDIHSQICNVDDGARPCADVREAGTCPLRTGRVIVKAKQAAKPEPETAAPTSSFVSADEAARNCGEAFKAGGVDTKTAVANLDAALPAIREGIAQAFTEMPAPSKAVIADLVEIGRRNHRKGCYGDADPGYMAIHDAAPDDKTALAAYAELMTVLAAEIRHK